MPANTTIYPQPADVGIGVWRYMDLSKFIDLLTTGELYFSTPSRFNDKFEGYTSRNIHWPAPPQIRISGDLVEYDELVALSRRWSYVNCWHLNDYESAAMWKLYAKSEEAVAIRTTYANLVSLLPGDILVAKVAYIDFSARLEMPIGAARTPLMYKRKSFEHEQELRLIFEQAVPVRPDSRLLDKEVENFVSGMRIPVNIRELIDSVYVAPESPDYFLAAVKSIVQMAEYSPRVNVRRSALDELPS